MMPTNEAQRLTALASVMAKIDAIAENAIRDGLDIPPLRAGELCPLRDIVDRVSRVQYAISDTLHARLQNPGAETDMCYAKEIEQDTRRDLDTLRLAIANGTMTQATWDVLTHAQRAAVADLSGLTTQLKGLEGWRVEVLAPDSSTVSGFKPRRFIVGRSTGWKPCHLEIPTRRSFGGSPAAKEYRQVRKLEKVR